jgi:hypothetical protein
MVCRLATCCGNSYVAGDIRVAREGGRINAFRQRVVVRQPQWTPPPILRQSERFAVMRLRKAEHIN